MTTIFPEPLYRHTFSTIRDVVERLLELRERLETVREELAHQTTVLIDLCEDALPPDERDTVQAKATLGAAVHLIAALESQVYVAQQRIEELEDDTSHPANG